MAAAGTFQQMREDLCYSSGNIILCVVNVNSEILALPELSPGNTWLRGSPERSFLGAYSLTREEKGTERQKRDRSRRLGVLPPAQPSRGGDARGGAAEIWRSGVRQRQRSSACSGIRRSKAVLVRGPLLRHCGSLPVAAW